MEQNRVRRRNTADKSAETHNNNYARSGWQGRQVYRDRKENNVQRHNTTDTGSYESRPSMSDATRPASCIIHIMYITYYIYYNIYIIIIADLHTYSLYCYLPFSSFFHLLHSRILNSFISSLIPSLKCRGLV